MTQCALTLALSESQATQFVGYCAEYRAHAWKTLLPSPERNQMMRAVQSVQGRISQVRAEGIKLVSFVVSEEEKQALRQMVGMLMHARGAEPVSPDRNRVLGELAGLRMLLERTCRQTQAL